MTPSASRWADLDTWIQTVPAPVDLTLNSGVLPTGRVALFFGATGTGRGIAAPTASGTSAASAASSAVNRAIRAVRVRMSSTLTHELGVARAKQDAQLAVLDG